MLVQKLKSSLAEAMKAHNETAKDVLRVALSEIQLFEMKSNRISEEQIFSVLRKIITNNEETIKFGSKNSEKLIKENEILLSFLPKIMNEAETKQFLSVHIDKIRAIPNDGLAMKEAITELKSQNLFYDGKIVSGIVREIRNVKVVI